jgi:hypothetical protein
MNFFTYLCMRALLAWSFRAQLSCLIRSCNNIRTSIVTGVTCATAVVAVCRTLSCEATISFRTVSSGGFGVCRSPLSELNENKPVAAHPRFDVPCNESLDPSRLV